MVSKKEVDKLLKKRKSWTGEQIGQILLSNLLVQLTDEGEEVPNEDINKMVANLKNPFESQVYNTYVTLYAGLIDLYNFLQASGEQATSSVTALKLIMYSHVRTAYERQRELNSPLRITDRQYQRYKAKQNSYLKKLSRDNKKIKVVLLDYLSGAIERLVDEPDSYAEVFPAANKLLAKSSQEPLPDKWKDITETALNLVYSDEKTSPHELYYLIKRGCYEDEIKSQYDKKPFNEDESGIVLAYRAALAEEKFKAEYNDMPEKEAEAEALEEFPLKIDNKPEKKPKIATKKDFLEYDLLECLDYKETSEELAEALNELMLSEFSDLIEALKADIVKQLPKLKPLLEKADKKDLLKPFATYGQLARAGIPFYKDMTSIPKLREETNANGIWKFFPEKDQERARIYGFAIYHPGFVDKSDSLNSYEYSNKYLMEEINDEKDSAKTISNLYSGIYLYLQLYQAYQAFVKGLVKFSHSPNLEGFSNVRAHKKFLNELDGMKTLQYMEGGLLSKVMNEKQARETRLAFKKRFPMIDLNKQRITPSTPQAIASYIDDTYSGSRREPVSSAYILSAISKGV